MSFFGFDTSLPRDRGHNPSAPGFSQAVDPFAGFSRPNDDGDDEAYVYGRIILATYQCLR